jgi:hypothetical protein
MDPVRRDYRNRPVGFSPAAAAEQFSVSTRAVYKKLREMKLATKVTGGYIATRTATENELLINHPHSVIVNGREHHKSSVYITHKGMEYLAEYFTSANDEDCDE